MEQDQEILVFWHGVTLSVSAWRKMQEESFSTCRYRSKALTFSRATWTTCSHAIKQSTYLFVLGLYFDLSPLFIRLVYELLKTPGKKKDVHRSAEHGGFSDVPLPEVLLRQTPPRAEEHARGAHTLQDDDNDNHTTQTDLDMVEEHLATFKSEDITGHHESTKELSMIVEDEEPNEHNRLSPVRSAPEPIAETEEDDAVPLRDVPHDPMNHDMTVPIRDALGPSLKRKPSVTQFSGLPAPSPLRKSMRMSHEPFAPANTPGAGLAGGKRTSWLTRAKEAKALDITGSGKRLGWRGEGSSAMPGISAAASSKDLAPSRPRSGETFDAGSTFPVSESSATTDEKKSQQNDTLESEALAFLRNKRNATSLDEITSVAVAVAEKTLAGARSGNNTGKSLGGNAAAELAEARKAAEARVAKRNKDDDGDDQAEDSEHLVEIPAETVAQAVIKTLSPAVTLAESPAETQSSPPSVLQEDPSRRMSVTDLMSDYEKSQATIAGATTRKADLSTSTTPPNSPPVALSKAAPVVEPPRVFFKPPTVFVAPPPNSQTAQPAPGTMKEPVLKGPPFKLPMASPFSLPAMTLGISSSTSGQKAVSGSSTEPNKANPYPDAIFDKNDGVPAWLKAAQEAEFVAQQKLRDDIDDDDIDDDSWQVDEQYKAGQTWTPFGFGATDKEDTMTWSTLPSRSTSQKGGDTGPMAPPTEHLGEEIHRMANQMLEEEARKAETSEPLFYEQDELKGIEGGEKLAESAAVQMSDFDEDLDKAQAQIDEGDLYTDDMELDDNPPVTADADLEDIIAAGQSTVSLVKVFLFAKSTAYLLTQNVAATTSCSKSAVNDFNIIVSISARVLWPGNPVSQQRPGHEQNQRKSRACQEHCSSSRCCEEGTYRLFSRIDHTDLNPCCV